MRVELDIFSGRPNPVWEIDAQASADLAALLATLAPARRAAPAAPDLGYRGLLYGTGAATARAYRGFAGPARAPLADPGRAVERFLLAQLPAGWETLRAVIDEAWE